MSELSRARVLPWTKGVRLVACDVNGLMAVEKSAGVLSHPNRKSDFGKALLEADYDDKKQAYRIEREEDGPRWVYLLNRLDSATSGLVLLTTNAFVRTEVLKAFEKKQVRKVYAALVFGFTRKGPPVWKDRLTTKKAQGGLRVSEGSGLSAETRLVASKQIPGMPAMSLLTLMPLTGRTHQLRIQTSKRGTPIVGDRTYGDFQKNKSIASTRGIKRLCLHCMETEITYSIGGKSANFLAKSKAPF
ncbi:MAG: RNA pseudouridine synthase [Opitutales bacterium]|nr:RNA pseudouridine synthase [Opitutales bacterium]MBT5814771.1 RNA pseudouridine synthase [Opitutales bacterium]MBT7867463.1 RNA pseudouridine synthase [Opitutales bacterium]MDG2256692.1 pseudouridine synthase [Opitutaceae bacterium]